MPPVTKGEKTRRRGWVHEYISVELTVMMHMEMDVDMDMDSVSFRSGARELSADLWVQRGRSSLPWGYRGGRAGEKGERGQTS